MSKRSTRKKSPSPSSYTGAADAPRKSHGSATTARDGGRTRRSAGRRAVANARPPREVSEAMLKYWRCASQHQHETVVELLRAAANGDAGEIKFPLLLIFDALERLGFWSEYIAAILLAYGATYDADSLKRVAVELIEQFRAFEREKSP